MKLRTKLNQVMPSSALVNDILVLVFGTTPRKAAERHFKLTCASFARPDPQIDDDTDSDQQKSQNRNLRQLATARASVSRSPTSNNYNNVYMETPVLEYITPLSPSTM